MKSDDEHNIPDNNNAFNSPKKVKTMDSILELTDHDNFELLEKDLIQLYSQELKEDVLEYDVFNLILDNSSSLITRALVLGLIDALDREIETTIIIDKKLPEDILSKIPSRFKIEYGTEEEKDCYFEIDAHEHNPIIQEALNDAYSNYFKKQLEIGINKIYIYHQSITDDQLSSLIWGLMEALAKTSQSITIYINPETVLKFEERIQYHFSEAATINPNKNYNIVYSCIDKIPSLKNTCMTLILKNFGLFSDHVTDLPDTLQAELFMHLRN